MSAVLIQLCISLPITLTLTYLFAKYLHNRHKWEMREIELERERQKYLEQVNIELCGILPHRGGRYDYRRLIEYIDIEKLRELWSMLRDIKLEMNGLRNELKEAKPKVASPKILEEDEFGPDADDEEFDRE